MAGANGGELSKLAAALLAPADGARVMMIETGGRDTHSRQKGPLAALFPPAGQAAKAL